jgi:hypothetical protein
MTKFKQILLYTQQKLLQWLFTFVRLKKNKFNIERIFKKK